VQGIEWIRLHYAFPTGFPEDVLEVIRTNDKVCNYIDIPLQHISDTILKSMRRGTTYKKTNALLRKFRQEVPGMAIRTTLIVGYPGETEEDFQELKEWVNNTAFDRLGVFTYSHEENTHAYLLDDNVPEEVKHQRAEEIMELQSKISFRLNQEKVGQTFKVLFDRIEGQYFIGRTEFDSPDVDNEVLVKASDYYVRIGDFAQVKITHVDHYDLYGVIVK
jgi:ribosomal protein S12 methylthiotransferase